MRESRIFARGGPSRQGGREELSKLSTPYCLVGGRLSVKMLVNTWISTALVSTEIPASCGKKTLLGISLFKGSPDDASFHSYYLQHIARQETFHALPAARA